MAINPASLAYIDWLFRQESIKQDNISAYRDYYDGDHEVELSERQQEYLQRMGDAPFCLNICPVVVDSMVDRMRVSGFRVALPPTRQHGENGNTDTSDDVAMEGEEPPEDAWAAVLSEWWQDNRCDALQRTVHKACARDGNSYVVVDWDSKAGRPRYQFQPAFTSFGDNPNNGSGVKVHMGEDGQIQCASKRWIMTVIPEDGGRPRTIRRMNLYFADRVEKYQQEGDSSQEGNWQEYREEGEPWPIPWLDEQGQPLGVPVVHFKNLDVGYPDGQSELKTVIPIQDLINKLLVDLAADADYSAFRILWQSGGTQPSGGVFPGAVWWDDDEGAKFGAIEGNAGVQFTSTMDSLIKWAASISRTPQYMFYQTGQMPSGEALKTAEAPLIQKVKDRSTGIGNAWEDVMRLSIKLSNTFGEGVDIPDGAIISCLWEDPASMTMDEQRGRAEFMVTNGYEEESLRIMGYDDSGIQRLMREKEERQAQNASLAQMYAQQARMRFEQQQPPSLFTQPQPGQFGVRTAAS